MQANQRKAASPSDPTTWSSFEDAWFAVRNGVYDYLGFVFNGDGLVGVDLDAGYDSEGFLTQEACDIIGHCASYTERSRSGRGVHIILRGKLPWPGKNNRHGVEIYETGRYFIVTGDRLMYSEIVENQGAISHIISTYFSAPELTDESRCLGDRFYEPVWQKPTGGKISLRPDYPAITNGSRNQSLTSLAGQLRALGYSREEIYDELVIANRSACEPPLPAREIKQITNSILRYRR